MRVVGGRGRTSAGFQSRLYSGRHSAHDSDRGIDRGGIGQPGDVLPVDDFAAGKSQSRWNRVWRYQALSAPGGSDGVAGAGHRGRRYGVAAGGGGDHDGHRDDPVQSAQPDAGGDRHVPAVRDDVGHLRGRDDPLVYQCTEPPGGPQRGAIGACGERGGAGGIGPDRR